MADLLASATATAARATCPAGPTTCLPCCAAPAARPSRSRREIVQLLLSPACRTCPASCIHGHPEENWPCVEGLKHVSISQYMRELAQAQSTGVSVVKDRRARGPVVSVPAAANLTCKHCCPVSRPLTAGELLLPGCSR